MTKDLIVGLVGVGRIGADHARTISTLKGIKELVLADLHTERAEVVAKELGARVSTPDDIISEVDVLIIATPTVDHATHLIAAAEAGVPVFCEKPVALDIETTERVRDAVARTGNLTQIGFMRRFDEGYINAKRLLQEGAIGKLHRMHVVTGDFPPPPASYLKGSGYLFKDCTIHDADAIRWVTGKEVDEVFVIGGNLGDPYFGEEGDIDNGVGVLRLEDGTLVTMQVSRYNAAAMTSGWNWPATRRPTPSGSLSTWPSPPRNRTSPSNRRGSGSRTSTHASSRPTSPRSVRSSRPSATEATPSRPSRTRSKLCTSVRHSDAP